MITITIDKSIECPDKYSAFISFNYNEIIVNTIKSLPFRYYHPNSKLWEIPKNKVSYIVETLYAQGFKQISITDYSDSEDVTDSPIDFAFKTKPFEHQKVGFDYGMRNNRWFLGDEQGLGKSKEVIDIAVAKKQTNGYKHCLIVCGVNTLKWNWVNEILTHSNELAFILGQKARRDGKIIVGSTKDKVADLQLIEKDKDNIQPYFIITNIESFRDKEFADTVKKLCDKGIINMCALDEAHKCKNPTSQQTKGFFKCLPEYRVAMTGTPIMNSPLDLYVILKWLGYETHSFTAFKAHYCIMGGFGGYEVVGYKNTEELSCKLQDIMLRRLKEDVFDLPEKTFVDEYVEMTANQAKVYKEVQSELKENIDKITSSIDPLSALIRLRQATGYTGILSTTIQESSKLDRMCDIVDEATANNKKVVIFSNWTQMTAAIEQRFADRNFYAFDTITGETKDEDRQYKVNGFQNGDTKVLIGTIGAMGTGLTLTAGTVVIFTDHPWSMALYNQAVDRCHRIGQTQNITIYNLMCKNTIDERIWSIVNKKGYMSDCIVDSKITGNKTELIDYLIGG